MPHPFEVDYPLRLAEIPAAVGAVAFFRAAFLGRSGVVAAEVLVGVAVDPVGLPLGEHQVDVRLLAAVRRVRGVDRPLVGVARAQLLPDEGAHQREPLRRGQFARQGDFHFAVGRAVGSLVPVGGLPEAVGFR